MNTLSIQLICLLAFALLIVCYRLLGLGFKPFAGGIAVIIVVWLVSAFFALLGFVKLASSSNLASLSLGGTMASVLALGFIAWFGFTVFQGAKVPPIHNISTDVANPPAFDKISALRAPSHNPLEYSSAVAQKQQQHYGHIQPLVLNAKPLQVFDSALTIVDQLGWQLQSQNAKTTVIEASVSSGLFGFVDDVVIRIQAKGDGSKVDMRSVSRVGQSDFGTNAKRIERFLALIAAQMAN